MSMGLFIGLITFYVLYVHIPRPSRDASTTASSDLELVHLTWILVLQSMIYLSSLSGILYPGAGWMDPQFGEGRPQLYGFPVFVALVWVGWGVEKRRILQQDCRVERGSKRE